MSRNVFFRRLAASVLVGGALTLAVAAIAKPPVPSTLTHQGRLYETITDEATGDMRDVPVTGDHTMTFAIYNTVAPTPDDAPLWSETQTVTFTDGYYAAALGLVTDFPDGLLTPSANEGRYLQITVDDQPPLSPLAKLGSVPYALVCDNATGDIHPSSVTVSGPVTVNGPNGPIEVIGADGRWTGDTTGLKGDKGDPGEPGEQGPPGAAGPPGPPGIVSATTAWGAGFNPSGSINFIGPTATVMITGANQKIFVVASKVLGSTAVSGGAALTLYMCYRASGGGTPTTVGTGVTVQVPSGTRSLQSLNADIAGNFVVGQQYDVGMCGSSSNPGSWNLNDNGYISAILHY